MTFTELLQAVLDEITKYNENTRWHRLYGKNPHTDAANFFILCLNRALEKANEKQSNSSAYESLRPYIVINYLIIFRAYLQDQKSHELLNAISPLIDNSDLLLNLYMNENDKVTTITFTNSLKDLKKHGTEERAIEIANKCIEGFTKMRDISAITEAPKAAYGSL